MNRAARAFRRRLQSTSKTQSFDVRPRVKIVEVSPRDGLQNESTILDTATKVDLIAGLAKAGLSFIEAGSFVSPKVKQMADTRQVLLNEKLRPVINDERITLSTLLPNMRGYQAFQDTIEQLRNEGVNTSRMEVAIFASATEAFSKANLNASRAEAMNRLAQVVETATKQGVRVRGYISCVVKCPYEGLVEPRDVAAASEALLQMGCYEISLGDTIGAGDPASLEEMLSSVVNRLPLSKLAIHCHDTNGRACENVLHLVKLGVGTVDSSIGGLGGCPFAPGAKGNVATEDVVHILEENFFNTGLVDPPSMVVKHEKALWSKLRELSTLGDTISSKLGRENHTRVAKLLSRY